MVIMSAMSAYLLTAFYLYTAIILLGNVNAECPYGWHHYELSCYFFSTDNYSWLNAQNSCRGHDARLAEVDNKAQSDYLMLMARTLGKDHNYWLGGRDDVVEGTWMWSSTDEFFTYTDWYPEQPNNYLGNQDCLHMHAAFNMKWQDESCTTLGRYICEKIYPENTASSPPIIG
ncbi:perlucin-like [Mytilus trossulus]|uniref:perlucin-like n=1 Tax=Mytilus trossulus TaxID=6551 RepID=UPI0030059CBC